MNIDQIIGKLMGDGSVGEEKSALEAWKKEAEDNISALKDIRKIAALSNTLNGYEDFDTNDAWNSFENKMESDTPVAPNENKKSASIFSINNLTRIAAVLVVVLGSVFVFNKYNNPSSDLGLTNSYATTVNILDFSLPDGSEITLDKNSNIDVVADRSVVLKGRAHFNIQRNESKQFIIQLPVGKIVVLGTEFTIDADDSTTEVYVSEGSVRYELANRTWVLVEGDLVKVIDNEPIVLKGRNENYDSWKNQRLMFRDNNMVEVVDALSRHFKKEIVIKNKKNFADCNVVNVFTNATLNEILSDLSKSHGLKFELKDNKVFIVSAEC
jgi:transmembrane sensor